MERIDILIFLATVICFCYVVLVPVYASVSDEAIEEIVEDEVEIEVTTSDDSINENTTSESAVSDNVVNEDTTGTPEEIVVDGDYGAILVEINTGIYILEVILSLICGVIVGFGVIWWVKSW